ncbi:unnamed protein product [Rotaria socialis]|uniref:Transposase n=2 Tax=Rotaria socialis TaxID=392032 RepID=A0A817VTE3_9BILA|nr:unnamed protein product [Rotaria socialis]CAF3351043.1 unnamed protein product [Rotaria socialis]CAF3756205.1 unnamed protein product [Rotaria socialis]CAF4411217.1 unnamed protein product [Rotaria socialis]CAF4457941.1 unnamed protein product [Rotaria socialis]
MAESNVDDTGKDIWSLISLDKLATAISSLGERIDQLKDDSWRLSEKTKSSSSCWSEVINGLKLDDNEKNRHTLYKVWHGNRHKIHALVDEKKSEIKINKIKEQEGYENNSTCNNSVSEKVIAPLHSEPSLPLPEPRNTRTYQKAITSGNFYERHCIKTEFISLTRIEWKDTYSRTHKKTMPGWTRIFNEKLRSIGNTCSLRFHSACIPSGVRKHNCSDFWFSTACTGDKCQRKYIVSHRRDMDNNLMLLFRVDTYGEENHSEDNIMRPRKISGGERLALGKRANEIGPSATFRELVEAADEDMLVADSTGGVLKPMKEQNDIYIYTIMFKDGIDALDNVPLAHAILTDHTVPGIGYFLGNVIHSVNQVTTKKKLRPPSFIIIDFSAALMNAALQQFNIETVNKHLKRCWNVIHRKYSAENIRSLSYIHLCCCHVMHGIARSLNAEKFEKKTREAVLYIFAYMLCSDDINQLYDTLGLVINIFGDPNEQNAKEKLDKICSLKLNVDEESESVLKDFDKSFRTAEVNEEELKLVDEYFESDEPIIHQSPFNKEAIKRYPLLNEIVIKKKIKSSNNNALFSASIMRIFYRW